MEIRKIPFVEKVGIEKNEQGHLTLSFDDSNNNHINTVHASALFTLAESASGEALQSYFPELVGKVIPVVRDSQIKFRKPAIDSITAFPSIADNDVAKFKEQFNKKGRSSIAVHVEVRDPENNVICAGTFNWFVQGIS
ncbi:MAG: PaaI family thioesterase [Candidatus Thiodiazotropha sp.]